MLVQPVLANARESGRQSSKHHQRISTNMNPVWKNFFNNWPAGIQRRGLLVTSLNEPVPFKGFMVKEDVLLLERTNPDSMGGRFVMVAFDAINLVKLIDPLKESVFSAAGFLGKLAKE
jgi:hypothetical protein